MEWLRFIVPPAYLLVMGVYFYLWKEDAADRPFGLVLFIGMGRRLLPVEVSEPVDPQSVTTASMQLFDDVQAVPVTAGSPYSRQMIAAWP